VLAAHQGPVEFYGQVNISAALEGDMVVGLGIEASNPLRVGLNVAQGLEASYGLGQALLGHHKVQVAYGAKADAGVESGR